MTTPSLFLKYTAILREKKLIVLFLCSLFIACIWQHFMPTCFTTDSIDYLLWARGLVGVEGGKFAPYRTPGYPLLLVATGVTYFQTFKGILILQTLMATAIPLLTYGIVRCYTKKWAILSGFLVLFSTIPMMYSTHIMTDHASMFLLYLFLFIACRYFWSGKIPSYPAVFLLTFVGWFDALVRPANMLIFYIAIFATLLFYLRNWEWWKRAGIALGCYLLLNTAWVAIDSKCWIEGEKPIFTRVYEKILSDNIKNQKYTAPIFDPNYGPATKEFVDQLQAAIHKYPQNWVPLAPEKQYGAYRENQAELVKRMTTAPSIYYRNFVPALVREAVSAQPSIANESGAQQYSQLLKRLAAEHGVHRFKLTPKSMLFGVSTEMDGKMFFWQAYIAARYYSEYRSSHFIMPENGPASKYFFDLLLSYLNEYPENWNTLHPDLFGKFQDSPKELHQNIINKPNATYWWFMWNVMDSLLGAEASTALFWQVAIEASHNNYSQATMIWSHFLGSIIGPGVKYDDGPQVSLPRTNMASFTHSDFSYYPNIAPYLNIIGESLGKEIFNLPNQPIKFFTPQWNEITSLYQIGYVLRPVLFFIVLVTFMPALISKARIFSTFGLLYILLQSFVTSIFSEPVSRYNDFWLPLLIMLAVIGVVHTSMRKWD